MRQRDSIADLKQESQDLIFIESTGFSMWPFLKAKDKLIVKKIPLEDLKIGDIILYIKDNQQVCHRLVKRIKVKQRYLIYARGDNLSSIELVNEDIFKGKVIAVLRKGRIRNLTVGYQQFINRIIVMLNPFIRCSLKIAKFLKKVLFAENERINWMHTDKKIDSH